MANSTLTQLRMNPLKILLMQSLSSNKWVDQLVRLESDNNKYKDEQSIFLAAIAQEHDPPEPSSEAPNSLDDGDDLFGERDKAIPLKHKGFVD
ncbi:hypothetical protein AMTR_s00035p00134860 [Amborella trichopoda]|uniref:Uncharacterized protein n=1 Tax=Amborella trichopoda TaxID=13333 RepID=W1PPT3_AMBTC|nr:hypothetical protein AMTR_s00035p00134860 [Amborella trichopoda]